MSPLCKQAETFAQSNSTEVPRSTACLQFPSQSDHTPLAPSLDTGFLSPTSSQQHSPPPHRLASLSFSPSIFLSRPTNNMRSMRNDSTSSSVQPPIDDSDGSSNAAACGRRHSAPDEDGARDDSTRYVREGEGRKRSLSTSTDQLGVQVLINACYISS